MILQDVMKVVGNSPLLDFPWGQNVILLVNSFTSEDFNLTAASTGSDLISAMLHVEESNRTMLLNAKVDMVSFISAESCANDALVGQVNTTHKMRNIIVVGFTMVLCFIALLLTFVSSETSKINGTDVDSEGLSSMLTILFDILKHFQE